MKKIFLLLLLISIGQTFAQISGCTDPLSKNYNPKATENDGSCLYATSKIKPEYSKKLSDSLRESSGLVAFDNLLWTHNDDHDKTIYGINHLGLIQKKISLEKAVNKDWEEISQDSTYLYIGDFGNNYTGNRTDLQILRIEKKSFLLQNPMIDTISFSYSNQTDLTKKTENTSDFDCEAFVVSQDSIYLFTKQWKKSQTSVYVLPKKPGNHVAQLKQTIDVQGLITGVTFFPSKKLIVLCGYSRIAMPFLYLLYDYVGSDFSSGNKRKIRIPLAFHQIESISTQDGLHYYLTNEALVKKPLLDCPQKIHAFDLSLFLSSYLNR